MKAAYFFSINNQPVGPLDIKGIKNRIAAHVITRSTLAWREGMDNWRPIRAIPELLDIFSRQEQVASVPPPLPGAANPQGKTAPPPLSLTEGPESSPTPADQPASTATQDQKNRPSAELGQNRGGSYDLLFRVLPKNSPIRPYLERNPGMSAPILVLALVGLLLILAFLIDIQTEETAYIEPTLQQPVAPAADWQSQYRAWQDTQRYNQGILDDVYKYQRDTQDRMDETYRRGTYDWYGKDGD